MFTKIKHLIQILFFNQRKNIRNKSVVNFRLKNDKKKSKNGKEKKKKSNKIIDIKGNIINQVFSSL